LQRQQLAEETSQLMAIVGIEPNEQTFLVRQVCYNETIDDLKPKGRQLDQPSSRIALCNRASHQSSCAQSIDTLGHSPRGNHHRLDQFVCAKAEG